MKRAATIDEISRSSRKLRVEVSGLHVLIMPDGDGWYAQGLEVDYAASGDSVDQVKDRFVRGFVATIRENVRKFGTLDRLLTHRAPQEYWDEFDANPTSRVLSCMSEHHVVEDALPDRLRTICFVKNDRHAA